MNVVLCAGQTGGLLSLPYYSLFLNQSQPGRSRHEDLETLTLHSPRTPSANLPNLATRASLCRRTALMSSFSSYGQGGPQSLFSRAPGSAAPPSNSSSSTYYTAQEAIGSQRSVSSLSALGFASDPQESFNVFNSRSPNLGGSYDVQPTVRSVDTSRPYPLVERRSFRDVSSAGDMVVDGHDGGSGSGATSRGRNTPTRGIGAIGDGRKASPEKPATEEQAHGGVFDGRGALSVSTRNSGSGSFGSNPPSASPTRPSSFILDLLPTRVPSQPLPGPSPEKTPSREDSDSGTSSSNGAVNGVFASSTLFHSPTSTTGPGLTLTSSTSRASSPVMDESHPGTRAEGDDFSKRFVAIESTVADLSTVVHTELRTLREEMGYLRGLILQSGVLTGGPQLPAIGGLSVDRDGTDSPLLTLRSPSPHRSPAFPSRSLQHPHSPSYLHLSSQSTAQPNGPPSPAFSAPGGLFQDRAQEERARSDANKDEQIRALQAQVVSLSSQAQQIGSGAVDYPSMQSPLLSGHSQSHYQPQHAQQHRQLSLPPLGSHPLGSPSLGGSPGLGSSVEGWKREVGTGLGVSTPSGPGGARSPLLRPLSANGNVAQPRQPSLGSSFGRSADDERRRSQLGYGASYETSNASNWDSPSLNGMPSLLVGMPGSPLIGNPAGSLGGKWEALGVGSELFRTIAKYGLGPPTKIQTKAIPCALRYQDIVSQAPSIQERIQSYVVPALQMICSAAAQTALEGGSTANKGIQVLIVTATVDQAAQAQRLSVGLGGSLGIRTSLCVGQGDLQQELATFIKSPPHVLVGTPQRLLDLFSVGRLPVGDIRLLVVDECDQLIARNLADFVTNLTRLLPPSGTGTAVNPPLSPNISRSPMLGGSGPGMQLPGAFDTTPRFNDSPRFPSTSSGSSGLTSATGGSLGPFLAPDGRQTIIFSCTVPQDVLNFASSLQLREPVRVLVRREGGESSSPSVRGIRQFYVYIAMGSSTKSKGIGALGRREASTAREWKLEALADLCEEQTLETCVIFCSSVDAVEQVSYKLGSRGIEALALHSDIGQVSRREIMSKFRGAPGTRPGSTKRALVVYDALTKSLTDINSVVPLVINYDLPRAVEDYVHRISCASTSAYGRPGIAINIVTPGTDVEMLRSIESFYRSKIAELPQNFSTAAAAA
ncbi:hypothetical protein P7C70_g3297, partial [Phenoliferia sp. Uapishka_3]